MPVKPQFCSQCGAAVEQRVVDDRPRQVCPACETIFYQNPLPVASAVVLNERREALLVKRRRQPHQGMWCLPIGFAELGETISDAAVRELREEAGISGRVLRLLDVRSLDSDFYGDLLIVTFELERVGGSLRAGDDAEAARFFPLAQLPPLAFEANERALRICEQIHRDEWAIHDSFGQLESTQTESLLSDALIALISRNAEDVVRGWLADVRSNPTTTSYRRMARQELESRAVAVLQQFARWLRGSEDDTEVRAFYRALGTERAAQGFGMYEVLSSLTLLRKHIFDFARSHGVWERPIDVYRVLELNRRIVMFFDKAMYHTLRGFATEPEE